MATYFSQAVHDQLDSAQVVINWHLVSCPVCATDRHCEARQEADNVFERYGRLPRRRPGLTQERTDPRGDNAKTPRCAGRVSIQREECSQVKRVTALREELQRLEAEGLGEFFLFVAPNNGLVDRHHRAQEAGVVINFNHGDYPVESVHSMYSDPEDAGYVFLEFGEPIWPREGGILAG